MPKQLYIVRGTGLNLDGSIVVVTKGEGDYYVVSPPNSKVETSGTMVHTKCLQKISGDSKTWMYQFTIRKKNEDPSWPESEERALQIHGCLRDVNLDTILEYIETNLSPILRME